VGFTIGKGGNAFLSLAFYQFGFCSFFTERGFFENSGHSSFSTHSLKSKHLKLGENKADPFFFFFFFFFFFS